MRVRLLVLVFAACGGGSSNPGPDAGPSGDAGPTVDGPPPSERALVQIQLEPPEFSGESGFTRITGGFQTAPDPRCRTQTVGACEVADCPQALGGTYVDPGRLSFTPALGGAIAFTPGASFLFFSIDQVPWAANESITLTADGHDVPTFSLTGQSPRTLDAGEGRSPFGAPIARSQPFTATWVPIAEDALVVLRQGRDTPDGEFEIIVQCRGPGSAGALTVPAAALASFLPDRTRPARDRRTARTPTAVVRRAETRRCIRSLPRRQAGPRCARRVQDSTHAANRQSRSLEARCQDRRS